jgi:hypothetical protein
MLRQPLFFEQFPEPFMVSGDTRTGDVEAAQQPVLPDGGESITLLCPVVEFQQINLFRKLAPQEFEPVDLLFVTSDLVTPVTAATTPGAVAGICNPDLPVDQDESLPQGCIGLQANR